MILFLNVESFEFNYMQKMLLAISNREQQSAKYDALVYLSVNLQRIRV